MKRIAILGSTGSIGRQTLDVVDKHPDKLEVVALACNTQIDKMREQAERFGVEHTALGAQQALGLIALDEVDCVVNAMVGAAGLEASVKTLEAGKQLALANKESLVVGGDIIMPLAKETANLLPIDSEHGAIFQCLIGEDAHAVSRLWITASGGPFRGWTKDRLEHITPAEALSHPTWNMGQKISIDSSTLMNKGLEVIEAHHLFDMPYEDIQVVVHPQSAIHSMVEFEDGSVKAHLGATDMRIPIQFALSYPERWESPVERVDFTSLGSMRFEAPDTDTFGCLKLAFRAGETGMTMPCAMNAANEVAVDSFLKGRSGYLDIERCVEHVMENHSPEIVESVQQLKQIDERSREEARAFLEKRS